MLYFDEVFILVEPVLVGYFASRSSSEFWNFIAKAAQVQI